MSDAALLAPAISGNLLQKAGRGRPSSLSQRFSPEIEQSIVELYPELTPRARWENILYAMTLATLWPVGLKPGERESRFEYLWNGGQPRRTILVALGRLDDDEAIRDAAERISANRLPAPVALARLRVLRLGRDVDRVAGLTGALVAAATNYGRAHPRLTEREFERALRCAELALAECADRKRLGEVRQFAEEDAMAALVLGSDAGEQASRGVSEAAPGGRYPFSDEPVNGKIGAR